MQRDVQAVATVNMEATISSLEQHQPAYLPVEQQLARLEGLCAQSVLPLSHADYLSLYRYDSLSCMFVECSHLITFSVYFIAASGITTRAHALIRKCLIPMLAVYTHKSLVKPQPVHRMQERMALPAALFC